MKTRKILLGLAAIALVSGAIIAADHIDAPEVKGGTSDITDFYAFQGENTDNLVFVANVQGLITPENSSSAKFDPNVMIEFNIDTNDDKIEDYVIQAIPSGTNMSIYGPAVPNETGSMSTILDDMYMSSVKITPYKNDAFTTTTNASAVTGVKAFAGLRDDPFFMDFAQYTAIVGGTAPGGFNNPGADTFAGTNVLSVVVEVPKSMIGGTGTINTWVTTKRKQ
ncbi:DUF4331 family protein [Wenyingzhuangia marina]|uniref:Molecular chaperone DnaK n=1 Tax=Wenyingzhuangia marina TaxID=1195760 RepID=A0A1M5SNJ4_9FLAO|nr:DUF4331 family protein [Wenyingzhuangia marina]GGF62936.1 hypothetical protein GCM10011397_02460 [Wenyingzhuangia marina]SHH39523.1 protein of unknown function [Wenyingzhuangia marina]